MQQFIVRVLCVLAFLIGAVLTSSSIAYAADAHASGGGNGTFDGVTSGSHFGFGVVFGSSVQGRFECNMAGNSAFPGLRQMAVLGTVTSGSVNVAAGTAIFRGPATLHVNGKTSSIGFSVEVHEGGPLVGTLHLTVFNSPFGPVFTFPVERVLTGQISVR
jgi:opacity protein-like surface antigen